MFPDLGLDLIQLAEECLHFVFWFWVILGDKPILPHIDDLAVASLVLICSIDFDVISAAFQAIVSFQYFVEVFEKQNVRMVMPGAEQSIVFVKTAGGQKFSRRADFAALLHKKLDCLHGRF